MTNLVAINALCSFGLTIPVLPSIDALPKQLFATSTPTASSSCNESASLGTQPQSPNASSNFTGWKWLDTKRFGAPAEVRQPLLQSHTALKGYASLRQRECRSIYFD
eukprot:c871_g1_i1.p1 GENE.c871_g1_i1~~c871_g1_i1.p1  ORF type:complete len:107 (+),score=17.19 c871_g1_i1:55-375(+)